ncbi:MAG: alpha/beta hydrolase [Candidatus Thermoplasmatota archaeon]|nr:alpha/beta hydrolase [Candidatus Thermoplasmatota archaeon]
MQRKEFQWNEYTISYLEDGSGDTLVLIHAFPFNALMWKPQLEKLANNFYIIAPDIPSFGSSFPTPNILTMDLAANFVNALLDHLDIKKANICGLSMGGYISLAFTEFFSEKLEKLILADTHGAEDFIEKKLQRQKFINEIEKVGTGKLLEQFVSSTLGPSTKAHNLDLVCQVRKIMEMAKPETIISALRGMAERPARFNVLKKIKRPVCVIVGEDDFITPLSDAEDIVNSTPNAILKVIPNSGHLSNIENPNFFNNVIKDFILENN